ncbi:ABC-2 type transport system permease protein [Salirhabdus euzebyi]|uniref:ABC-2 type transport system permease protein n=1 Tax=Salirhabdus euzebyi TaxID=394506 RepID=A0A841QA13_9BACI|nr:ABC transporter permease subunit [Salirhabdus euzebyi]MBB6455077.1 ABC-2 type transport system permease protein [Salirhabdus euzebyi]
MQWAVIFKKEMVEYARNVKWIWVPMVFLLFGIMDQITTYYLPKILESVGGMPEGAELNIPIPDPPAALYMSISEFNMLGVMVIALISMGLIAGELKSGVYELVLSKPVKYSNYITAKWAGLSLLVLSSVFLGYLGGWYYVNILYGELAFSTFIVSFLIYTMYILFFITISVFVNTLVKNPGLVLFLSIALLIAITIITRIFGHILSWSPGHLSSYVNEYLHTGTMTGDMWATMATTLAIIVLLLFTAVTILKNKEL